MDVKNIHLQIKKLKKKHVFYFYKKHYKNIIKQEIWANAHETRESL